MIKPGVCDSPVPVPSSPGGEDGFSPLGEKLDIEVYQFRRFSPWGLGVIESNANLAGDKMTLAAKRYAPKRGKGNQRRQGWRKSSGSCCRRARSTMAPGPDFQAPFGAGRGWSGGDFFALRKKEDTEKENPGRKEMQEIRKCLHHSTPPDSSASQSRWPGDGSRLKTRRVRRTGW